MGRTADEVLNAIASRLDKVTGSGNRRKGCCPAHDDEKPSLELFINDKGCLAMKCWAGCSTDSICKALGIDRGDLNPGRAAKKPFSKIVKEYDYEVEKGKLLFQVVRFEPKDFRQRRPDGKGGWIYKLGDTRRVLFRLPELKAAAVRVNLAAFAPTGQESAEPDWSPIPVAYVPEGEKDVMAFVERGHLATCCPGGAGKWKDEYSEDLVPFPCVLVRDKDPAGYAHVREVYASLRAIGIETECVEAKEGKDAYDHFAAGYGVEDFVPVDPQEVHPDEVLVKEKPQRKKVPCVPSFDGSVLGEALPLPSDQEDEEPGGDEVNLDLTDHGNARRFVRDFGPRIRFCLKLGGWHCWDGRRWRLDETGMIQRMFIESVNNHLAWAYSLGEEGKPYMSFATGSKNRSRIVSGIDLARYEEGVSVSSDEFDRDPWLLNVRNGVVDLRTGDLTPPDPKLLMRRLAEVHYDLFEECPRFLAFLERVLPDPEVRAFIQRYAGYSLTGDTSAHCMVFLYGLGRNGKSTLVEILKEIMGDYAKPFRTDALMHKRQMDAGTLAEIADLAGVRMTASVETEEGVGLNEALIKTLTGGEEITAKYMHKDPFRFRPQNKMWMSGNHKPNIRGSDDGIWERVKLVLFDVQIPADERDPRLMDKLREEAPGILAWMVQGALDYLKGGLRPPEAVRAATEEYRTESDMVGTFLDERTQPRADLTVTFDALFGAFKPWCKNNGFKEPNKTTFGKKLQPLLSRRNLVKLKSQGGIILINGITLRDTPLTDYTD